MRNHPKRATYLYVGLTFAFSALVWTFIIWSGHLRAGFGVMIPMIMWCPAMAALVTCRILGREFRSLAWHWPKHRYLYAAYFVPIAYGLLAYGAVWACGLGGWNSEFVSMVHQDFGLSGLPPWASFGIYIFFMTTGGLILNVSVTLGEEIGWRGFLIPELAKRMSFTKLSLLSGIIWTAWHVPLLFFADYNVGTNRWYALGCSTVSLVSLSFILAWLRLKSASLWTPTLFHASHNLFVPCVFDMLIRNTGSTLWYTTQFGAALAITISVFAFYFWTRRAEVETGRIELTEMRKAAISKLAATAVTSGLTLR
jgi:uncharacterized protein